MNRSSTLPYWLSLMVLLVAAYGGWKWWQVRQFETAGSTGGIEFTGPPLTEFELTERSGKLFRSREMLGKVWVTTFFFSSCPGPCERLNSTIRNLHNEEQLKDVVWVSITVDPKHDTLPRLQKYAERFQADPERWLFCRGDLQYIMRVGRDVLNLPVRWQSHNEYAVVIDRQGVLHTYRVDARDPETKRKIRYFDNLK